MEKKAQKNKRANVRKPKLLTLNKETIYLLESSDLAHVAGGSGLSRSLCGGTDTCCGNW
ncbi:MAG TPA: hypothetical protein VLB76_29000 [Thermoanaerobaculia bacterium]|nr:hypothetical protein [Thermoanaerobaculia bacterium]